MFLRMLYHYIVELFPCQAFILQFLYYHFFCHFLLLFSIAFSKFILSHLYFQHAIYRCRQHTPNTGLSPVRFSLHQTSRIPNSPEKLFQVYNFTSKNQLSLHHLCLQHMSSPTVLQPIYYPAVRSLLNYQPQNV